MSILNTAINKKNPLNSVANYEANQVELDDKTDTVQGRVKDIISENSPIMQQANTRALQKMNNRGLLNSSIAIGEGQRAVYDAAIPIASQDAATSVDVKKSNQNASNTASQFNANSVNQASAAHLTGQQSIDQIKAQGQIETGLQTLRGNQATDLATIENEYDVLLQANQSAGGLYATISTSISEILAEPDLPNEQKEALVARQIELLRSGLGVIGGISNLNLEGLLDYGTGGSPSQSQPGVNVGSGVNTNNLPSLTNNERVAEIERQLEELGTTGGIGAATRRRQLQEELRQLRGE